MTPAFERLRQEDSEFQASLGYLSQNKTKQTNKNYKEPKSAATTQYAQPEAVSPKCQFSQLYPVGGSAVLGTISPG
jgi:hypothetical protein